MLQESNFIQSSQNQKPTIIIADDDLDDRLIAIQAIKEAGIDVHILEAKDGREALDIIHTCVTNGQWPNLVLLDLNMPVINGFEAATRLRTNVLTSKIPLVIFTTSNYPKDKQRFEQLDIAMVTKPLTFSAYQNTLIDLIEKNTH